MYNPKFDQFKEKFLNDPETIALMDQLSKKFNDDFKKEIIDELDEEEIYESLDIIYTYLYGKCREDIGPNDFTIFDIFLFKQ